MFLRDIRISQVRDIVDCMVGKKKEILEQTYILLKTNNDVIIIQDNTVIYSTKLRDIPEGISLIPIGFRYSDITEYNDRDIYVNDPKVIEFVNNTYYNYTSIINNDNLLYVEDNLKENPRFNELLSLKTGDGLKYYQIFVNNKLYLVPMFSGLMSISKPDNVGIRLYKINDQFTLVHFIIYKKRIKNTVNLIFRILNL